MKLRVYRDSLRFRLSPADVAQLDADGMVVESTRFAPGAEFSYGLRAKEGATEIRAVLSPRAIWVEIPRAMVRSWSCGMNVGLQQVQSVGGGSRLDIVIEKDFECLDGKSDDQGVALFPNPGKTCAS